MASRSAREAKSSHQDEEKSRELVRIFFSFVKTKSIGQGQPAVSRLSTPLKDGGTEEANQGTTSPSFVVLSFGTFCHSSSLASSSTGEEENAFLLHDVEKIRRVSILQQKNSDTGLRRNENAAFILMSFAALITMDCSGIQQKKIVLRTLRKNHNSLKLLLYKLFLV